MISKRDWKLVEEVINNNFAELTAIERKGMIERLKEISVDYNDASLFCTYAGSRLAKVGIRYDFEKSGRGTFYFVTDWYDELMDL